MLDHSGIQKNRLQAKKLIHWGVSSGVLFAPEQLAKQPWHRVPRVPVQKGNWFDIARGALLFYPWCTM
eukprot:9340444-Pyramimonas_sp.AAC.1